MTTICFYLQALGDELSGSQLLSIIREVGSETPAITLVPDLNAMEIEIFDEVLLQPFTTQSLLHRINTTLNLQIHPIILPTDLALTIAP